MMSRRGLFCLLLIGVIWLFCFPALLRAASQEESEQWLAAHNRYRGLHGVSPLVWSERIAASALAYAETCPSGHSATGYGENLSWASYGMGVTAVVTKWYDEQSLYDYANPRFITGTGHFTQIIWKGTVSVGCARVTGCGPEHSLNANTWVCQYDPPGNYISQFSQNVFPPLLEK